MNTNMHPSCIISPPTTLTTPRIPYLIESMMCLGYRGQPIVLLHTGQAEYYAISGAQYIHVALQLNLELPVHILDMRHHDSDECSVCPTLEKCIVPQLLNASTNEQRLALLVNSLPLATEAIHIMQLEVSYDLFN